MDVIYSKEYLQQRNQYPQTSLRNKQMSEESLWGGNCNIIYIIKDDMKILFKACIWLQRLHVNLCLQIWKFLMFLVSTHSK